jgi:hypothetical protein
MVKKVPLRVFHNDILFQFEDEGAVLRDGKISARGFKEKTEWGFVFTSSKESASAPRWVKVLGVGPDVVSGIFVGRRVLVENLKWTDGVEFEGQKYWKTTDEFILCVDSTEDR